MCIFCTLVHHYLGLREDYYRLQDRNTSEARLMWRTIQIFERRLGFIFAREFALGRNRGSYRWDHL